MPFDGHAHAEIGVARLLRAARALIASEDHWLQGSYETDLDEYCAVGALQEVAAGFAEDLAARAHALLLDEAQGRGFETVEVMNDSSSHALVLSSFDAAIARAEGGLARLPMETREVLVPA